MVYSLLSILGTHNRDDVSRTLLAMSTSTDSCLAMRQSGCVPLLVRLIHDIDQATLSTTDHERSTRARASVALHNIVMTAAADSRPDDVTSRYEARVLRLLEQLRSYCDHLRPANTDVPVFVPGSMELHPGPAIAALMKLSFDEQHRQAICTLGGLQAIAELLQVDNDVSGNTQQLYNVTMRRYACMTLTNLTFADCANKALLCSMLPALRALVCQLESPCDELCQVAASVVRNLSWHSDLASKRALSDVEAATVLMRSAMTDWRREVTLKSLLCALWNLSSHSPDNKAEICSVAGALDFLVNLLSYRSPSKTLSVVENAGGILRNVSSHVAVRDDYRAILRRAGCLQTLLRHLRSPSLTVVSNACGTLWNLSARCAEDQSTLLQLGAVGMLKNLVHSRHRMISMGSAAALKNLLTAASNLPCVAGTEHSPLTRCSDMSLPVQMPVGLHIRRQRALEDDLNRRQLTETCDDMDSPTTSPTGTLRSPVDVRSNNACFIFDRRIQSPSPIRQSDRSAAIMCHRSASHPAVSVSYASVEISACDQRRTDYSRKPDWASTQASSVGASVSRDRSNEEMSGLRFTNNCQRQSSVTSSSLSSPSSPLLSTDFVFSGVGSQRFLKSYVSRKPNTEPSTGVPVSFLSGRTENIHFDDLELKSSYDFDAPRQSGSPSAHASVDVDDEQQLIANRISYLSSDALHVNVTDRSNDGKTDCTADETINSDVPVKSPAPHNEALCGLDQLTQLLPCADFTLSSDAAKDVTNSSSQQYFATAAEELSESGTNVVSRESIQLQQNTHNLNSDKVQSVNISVYSDMVSDLMEESFTDLTQSTNVLEPDVTSVSSCEASVKQQLKQTDPVNKDVADSLHAANETMFARVDDGLDSDVLCCNSAELLSLLEENANRVVRELELKTAEFTSSSEFRLLEDETISLVSGHNDNELGDDNDDDDDDDDDYIDAISSRTYDISSASGEAACLSSRHSSSRSPSSGSDSRHSSPSAPAVTPRRAVIVKPDQNTEQRHDEHNAAREGKGIRGRRKVLHSVTRPRIPPASQSTTRQSSAVKSRPVAVVLSASKRPASADATSTRPKLKPTIVRPATATSKQSSVSNKPDVHLASRRVSSSPTLPCTTTSRAKPVAQTSALKKPLTTSTSTTQSNVVENRVKRPADTARCKSMVSSCRASASNKPPRSAERPTLPVKQATFVKNDHLAEETNSVNDESVAHADAGASNNLLLSTVSTMERPAVLPASKHPYRSSSASSVRSNKDSPAVVKKTAAPVRAPGSTTTTTNTSKFTEASKAALLHSSPSSAPRTETSQPSVITLKSSSQSSLSTSTARSTTSIAAARLVRKPASSQPQSAPQSTFGTSKKPSYSAEPVASVSVLTRTSTYDKLNEADKAQCSGETVNGDSAQTCNVSAVNECDVLSSVDSKVALDGDLLSQSVIRRARQLVEQADQIQIRSVSPPHSIRFSSCMQPEDVVVRLCDSEMNAQPESTDTERQSSQTPRETAISTTDEYTTSPAQFDTCTSALPSPADTPKRSPIRKFGFIGLWRRQRPDQPVTATDRQKREEASIKSTDATPTRHKAFSWWRRTTTPVGTMNAERAASKSSNATTCRSAVVTPFSYRPSLSPPPSVFADLPQSHQTKTAMLIERRMRRLKMASESSSEQTSPDCFKSKADVASKRKNLVTTV